MQRSTERCCEGHVCMCVCVCVLRYSLRRRRGGRGGDSAGSRPIDERKVCDQRAAESAVKSVSECDAVSRRLRSTESQATLCCNAEAKGSGRRNGRSHTPVLACAAAASECTAENSTATSDSGTTAHTTHTYIHTHRYTHLQRLHEDGASLRSAKQFHRAGASGLCANNELRGF